MEGISQRGHSYRIRWRDQHRRRHTETHASLEDAKLALRRHLVEVDEIKRGLRSLAPVNRTIDQLCDYWLEHRAPRKRSERIDISIIRAHLRPALGDLLIAFLTRVDPGWRGAGLGLFFQRGQKDSARKRVPARNGLKKCEQRSDGTKSVSTPSPQPLKKGRKTPAADASWA
ncbi:MAG: hypothetical protein JXR83_19610 [Deltaproteobacteria bacterium]|nr:hypothetical protein [Deltaproteobacteria bacterium]